jgi:hypothetical protein
MQDLGMQDQGKRLLLTVALAFGVLFLWNTLNYKEEPPPDQALSGARPNSMDTNYRWSADRGGLELGLRVTSTRVRAGQAIDVHLAVRNRSSTAQAIAPDLALVLRNGNALYEGADGPRSSDDLPIGAGEMIELASWRVTERLGTSAGPRILYAVLRPRKGGELRSPEVRVEVVP